MSVKEILVIYSKKLYLQQLIEGQFNNLEIITKIDKNPPLLNQENETIKNIFYINDSDNSLEIIYQNNSKTITKPIEARVLFQSINNILLSMRSIIIKDDITLNKMLKTLEYNDKIYKLTEKEADFLFYIMSRNYIINKENILKDIWGYKENVDSKTLETHIYKLKKKIPFFDFSFL